MVSTAELMEKMKNKSSPPKPKFKPLSAQRGLTEMFKPQIVDVSIGDDKNNSTVKTDPIISKKTEGNTEISNYEERIRELEAMLLKERSINSKTSANEEKVLNAIRCEIMKQKCEQPIITRSMFLKIYKINSRYLDDSISKLIEKKTIAKEEVKYSTKVITHSWRILN